MVEVGTMTLLLQTVCSEFSAQPAPQLSGPLGDDRLETGFGSGTPCAPKSSGSPTSTLSWLSLHLHNSPPIVGRQASPPATSSLPLPVLLPLTSGPLPCRLSWNLLGDEAAAELARVLPQMGRLKRMEYEGHILGGQTWGRGRRGACVLGSGPCLRESWHSAPSPCRL